MFYQYKYSAYSFLLTSLHNSIS